MSSRLLYPDQFIGILPLRESPETLMKIEDFTTAMAKAHRVRLRFLGPIDLVIRITSHIGRQRRWLRAGSLAQVIYGLPGHPKKQVFRLYRDERYIQLAAIEHTFYLEFWPYKWLTDYRFELWIKRTETPLGLRIQGTSLIFDGEILTVDGERIL